MSKYEELFRLIKEGGFLKEKKQWELLQGLNGLNKDYKAQTISAGNYQYDFFRMILKTLGEEFPNKYILKRRLSPRGEMTGFYEVQSKEKDKAGMLKIFKHYQIEKVSEREKLLDDIVNAFSVSNHKHIPTAHYFGYAKVRDNLQEDYFLVTDYIEGSTFFDLATNDGLKKSEMIKHLEGIGHILDALAYLHIEKKIMHRSCHAGNMVYDEKEGKGYLTGLTTLAGIDDENKRMTQTGKVIGIYPFLPPETFMGQSLGLKSDVYSIGASIAMYLDGAYPRGYKESGPGSMLAVMDDIRKENPIRIQKDYNGSKEVFSEFIEKATQVDTRKRYENAQVMSEEFKQRLEDYKKKVQYHQRFYK